MGHRLRACRVGHGHALRARGIDQFELMAMSPALPQVQELFVRQMRKLAEIGADGVHIDKFFGAGLDFNPLLTVAPDEADHAGMLQ